MSTIHSPLLSISMSVIHRPTTTNSMSAILDLYQPVTVSFIHGNKWCMVMSAIHE